jgi:hypothetical protein
MSDPSSPSSPSSPPSNDIHAEAISRRDRQVLEDEITARFFSAFSQRMEHLIQTKNFDHFEISQEERSIIKHACTFMSSRGLAAGATTLAMLRGYRGGVFGRMKRAILYLPAPSSQAVASSSSSRWGLDITIGSVVGLSVMIQSAASGQIFQDMAKIPLLPGRSSAVSRQCCEASVEEYRSMIKDYRASKNTVALEVLERPETGNLKGFMALCQNCQKRHAHETKLRQEQNLDDDSPVYVAPPGVPEDTKISIIEEEEEESADEVLESNKSYCIIM